MHVNDFCTFLYSILRQHSTTWLSLHHPCINNLHKDQDYQQDIACMGIMHTSMNHTCLFHSQTLCQDQGTHTIITIHRSK